MSKLFKKILKNSTLVITDTEYNYCMVEYFSGWGDDRTCETYYVFDCIIKPVLEQTKSVKTLLQLAKDNRLIGSTGYVSSIIPPSENTDSEVAAPVVQSGVVTSEGDTLSDNTLRRVKRWGEALSPLAGKSLSQETKDLLRKFPTLMVASSLERRASPHFRSYPKHPKEIEFLRDDDIPPSFGLGV